MRFLLASLCMLLAGCFTVQGALRENLGPLQHTSDDHVLLAGAKSSTRLTSSSPVKFHFNDGSESMWLSPSRLRTNATGVFTESAAISTENLQEIEIRDLSESRRLEFEAHSEGLFVRSEFGVFEIRGPGPALRAWADAARAVPEPDEAWRFVWPGYEWRLKGSQLVGTISWPASITYGARWNELSSIEVQHPDYGTLLVALAVMPFLLSGGGGISTFALGENRRPVTVVEDPALAHLPKVEIDTASRPTPIFSSVAERRATVRPVAAFELGSTLTGLSSSAGVFAGVRLRDWFEAGIIAHAWWPHLFSSSPSLSSEPLGPLTSKYKATPFAGARLGVNLDLDADRRVLVPLHAELATDFHGHLQVRIAWGLQVRIIGHVFAALRPFTPQYTSVNAGIDRWQFPSSLEFGATF